MKKILAIGPHPDDIELGCFGSMAKLSKEGNEIHFLAFFDFSGMVLAGSRNGTASQTASRRPREVEHRSTRSRPPWPDACGGDRLGARPPP